MSKETWNNQENLSPKFDEEALQMIKKKKKFFKDHK